MTKNFYFLLFLFLCYFPLSLFANNNSSHLKNFIVKGFYFEGQIAIESKQKIIHIKDFGAVGNGVTNCTEAFQKAAAYLQVNGGTLVIDPGIYIVGKQRLSGSFEAGSSYFAEPILSFKDAKKPIKITGYNATLKAADGLKYGSFNPVTGEKDSIRKKSNRTDYYASAYTFINATGCSSVSIKGLTLDGNSGKLNMGPGFGPAGNQLPATGVSLYNNKKVVIADCYIHHCALDAILIGWTGLKNTDPIYPHSIKNVKARYNGRQGLSWVGGNNLMVINSEFSSTGKALNNNIPVVGLPAAGIDIEIENSIIKNGNFINCFVYNNSGYGLSSIGHNTYNINFKNVTFIGTTNDAAFPKSQCFSFDSCTFIGKVVGIHGDRDRSKANLFKNCLFTMDPGKSPNGKVFGNGWGFYDAQNVIFDNCVFNAVNKRLPVFNTKELVFINCKFIQNGNEDFRAIATFIGTTQFLMKGKGKVDASEGTFKGKVLYNNQRIIDIKKTNLNK
jgi:hypothetical protein